MWETVLGWFGLQRRVKEFSASVPIQSDPAEEKPSIHLQIGAGSQNNVQIGYLEGNFKLDKSIQTHHHQHSHDHQHRTVMMGTTTAAGPVVVNHHHYHMRTDMPMQRAWGQDSQFPPDEVATMPRPSKAAATPRQRQVLALMKRTGNEKAVLRWMEKTFGTRWVVALDEAQLQRVEQYCETVIHNAQTKRRVEMRR